MKKLVWSVVVVAAASSGVLAQAVDGNLPVYQAAQGVSGTIRSIGSDTMNNVMALWGEAYQRFYPSVKIEVEGKGSKTAPPALIENQAQFGPMSREMKPSEIDEFEKKFGYKPTQLRTGIDCLAIFVHKDCPLSQISLDDVERVFSVAGPEMTWGDLGVGDPAWKRQRISLYGRNSASGTYDFFKQAALGGRDYKATVKEQPGSSAVVQGVATDRFAMGYSGLGYKTAGVKALAVSTEGDEAFAAEGQNAYSGDYPLARFLYVYVNKVPGRDLDPLRAEFIKLIFSRQGQEVVVKDGYIPITEEIAAEELNKLDISVVAGVDGDGG